MAYIFSQRTIDTINRHFNIFRITLCASAITGWLLGTLAGKTMNYIERCRRRAITRTMPAHTIAHAIIPEHRREVGKFTRLVQMQRGAQRGEGVTRNIQI